MSLTVHVQRSHGGTVREEELYDKFRRISLTLEQLGVFVYLQDQTAFCFMLSVLYIGTTLPEICMKYWN